MQYDTIGWNLASGDGFSLEPGVPTPVRAPVYPFFLSFIYFIFGHSYLAVRLAQTIVSALTCLVIYWLGKEIFDEGVGRVASLILALYPILIGYTGLLLTETLFTFLLSLAVLFLVRAVKNRSSKSYAISGMFLGITALCRATVIFFPLFLFVGLWAVYRVRVRAIVHFSIFLLMMVVVIAPWTVRNYFRFHTFLPVATGGGLTLWAGTYVPWDGKYQGAGTEPLKSMAMKYSAIELDKRLFREGLKNIKEHPIRYLIMSIRKFPEFWVISSDVFGIYKTSFWYIRERRYFPLFVKFCLLFLHSFLVILAIIGFSSIRQQWKSYIIPLLLICYFTGHIFLVTIARYHLPALPYVFIFTSVCLIRANKKIIESKVKVK
ncbi:hypothetical protein ES705_01962 [subsurface metagenome]